MNSPRTVELVFLALSFSSTCGRAGFTIAAETGAATDVCVCAATPGGVLAALAAAREGRSVLVVEPSRWLGGICGAGLGLAQDCPIPEAVGGLAKKAFPFGRNLGVQKGFRGWLEERKIPVIYEHRVSSVEKQGARIVRVRFEKAPPDKWGCPPEKPEPGSGITVEAKVFIDASYEGDLMARAEVKYAVGREPAAQYNEKFAGVRPVTNFAPIDPYVKPGDPASGLLPHVEADHGWHALQTIAACRAGTATPFWHGGLDSDFSKRANLADAAMNASGRLQGGMRSYDWVLRDKRFDDGAVISVDAGKYAPNPWGLCDMHGNVAEWTRSAYRPYPYRDKDGLNDGTDGGEKVVRGGSWHDRPFCCTSIFRLSSPAWQRVCNVGFRGSCWFASQRTRRSAEAAGLGRRWLTTALSGSG